MWLQLFFWISSSVPLQWLSSKKLMECLKGQRFQFLGMFQWFCEKANFGCKGKFWLNFGQNLPFHRTLSKKPKFAFSLKAPPVEERIWFEISDNSLYLDRNYNLTWTKGSHEIITSHDLFVLYQVFITFCNFWMKPKKYK